MVASSILLAVILTMLAPQLTGANVPSLFVLGDSIADVGTNSFIANSKARADFPFNGIDFPNSRATGRFSNGFNTADYVAKLMGFKRSPQPFLYLVTIKSGLQRLKFRGVNFASGGSGILDQTGQDLKVVPLSEQIKQFATVRSNLTVAMGPEKTPMFLSESIFSIGIGSNDILGYFSTNSTVPQEQFINGLMNVYESYIKSLYSLGARKFGIISVPPLGCIPSQRIFNSTGGCFEIINDFSRSFHSKLSTMLLKISSEFPAMKYSIGNIYEITMNFIDNPLLFNFKDVETACCGNGKQACTPSASLCLNRSEYLFWDSYHPTQAASLLGVENLYRGGERYVSPINFSKLTGEH
ncbi:GDSL esterase/lipase [Heracleum sosnowskyi]|uniref:GDSL esterase/lipase n=1 Tax=Heracleum sosnowskyi TaxID=360622 RepID=A0AAD8MK31_9APIA|nr:GDSL esterase/lipase [Heracleum sosnowskyi]